MFYIGNDTHHTKANFDRDHYNCLVKLLSQDKSNESQEILAGLQWAVTGDTDYLLPTADCTTNIRRSIK